MSLRWHPPLFHCPKCGKGVETYHDDLCDDAPDHWAPTHWIFEPCGHMFREFTLDTQTWLVTSFTLFDINLTPPPLKESSPMTPTEPKLETVRFTYRDGGYRCSSPGDMDGEYVKADSVAAAIHDARNRETARCMEWVKTYFEPGLCRAECLEKIRKGEQP